MDVSTLELQPCSDPHGSQQLKDKTSFVDLLHSNYSLTLCVLIAQEPSHVGEALQQSVWQQAMEVKLASIEKNGTWELVSHPPSQKVIGAKWVFKTKYFNNGSLGKHKACLVAKGYA